MKLTIYIDGACRFNPGPAGIGVWIVDGQGKTLAEISEFIGQATNNIAEWSAYLRALREAKKMGAEEVSIFTDSQLLVEQVRGNFKVRDERLKVFWRQAKQLQEELPGFKLAHVPREINKMADSLAKRSVEGKVKSK
ncbi:MAG: ribonuclease HI family protein [Elusimicrobia bacterium]|nr:ribonuclease HI family protein [Elusimicrobiota bacterium]